MKKKLYLLLAFVFLGVIQAVIFMMAYADRFAGISFAQRLLALIYSVPQSLMVGAWVMLVPFVLGFVYVWIRGDWHRRFMIWYVTLIFAPMLFLCCLDWVLYGFWGFRLDTTPFIYVFDDPLEAARQSPWWSFPLTFAVVFGLCWLVYRIMRLVYPPRRSGSITRMNTGRAQQREGLYNLLLSVLMGIVGSGCFGLMGISSAYHSQQQVLNHAATSPIYSFFHSVRHQRQLLSQQYRFMSDDECQQAMQQFCDLALSHGATVRADSILGPLWQQRTDSLDQLIAAQPNVLVVLFESFSGAACHYLNPDADPLIMPNVCQAMQQGIAFTQCYANSFRTERGIVSVLSAYPGQPTYSLMTDTPRCQHLPYLTQSFAQAGYSLQFIHGGDGQFCGLPAYLSAAGIERVISRQDYPDSQYDSPWGMHDAYMYDQIIQQMRHEVALPGDSLPEYPAQPFFKVFTTLSSHEPFQVPMQRFADPYLNSVAYADSCFGAFISQLQADTLLWNNLLIIGLPDHCYANYPDGIEQHSPQRYHIPMFWTGGAVHGHMDVDVLCQQTDLAATLLHRLHLPADDFQFSHDVFDIDAAHFAFYAWPDGFGLLTDTCRYVQDNYNAGSSLLGPDADPAGTAQRLGQAYLQHLYDDMDGLLRP